MMNVEEMKTQVVSAKEKMFGGEVTMARKDLALVVVISVLAGMILGLCKGLKVCVGKKDKECKCKTEDCCQMD